MAKILVVGSLAESLVNFRGDMLRHFVAAGHAVTAAAPSGPAWVDARLADWGVKRVVLPLQRTGTGALADLRLVAALWRVCRREQPDVMLGYTIKPVVYGSLAARLAGVPRIGAMVTGLGFAFAPVQGWRRQAVRGVAQALYRLAMHCAHVALFQNPDDEADFRTAGLLPARLEVVRINGSGVSLQRFASQPMPAGPRRFVLVARLLADKGIREYLQAARMLKASHPQVQCHLVGPADSNPAAVSVQEVEQAARDGVVHYHGAVQDVRPILASSHVYVLPSYREGTPRSVLEALAVGRPVITTDAPGCRETVEPNVNGQLVPVADAPALASAMQQYAELPDSTLQAQATASRQLAEAKYDVRLVNAAICRALRLNAQENR